MSNGPLCSRSNITAQYQNDSTKNFIFSQLRRPNKRKCCKLLILSSSNLQCLRAQNKRLHHSYRVYLAKSGSFIQRNMVVQFIWSPEKTKILSDNPQFSRCNSEGEDFFLVASEDINPRDFNVDRSSHLLHQDHI